MSGLQTYFEDGYLRRWKLEPPTPTQLAEAVNFLGLAGAGEAALVLDLGCGHGRYAVGMARAGARVIGLDSSYALLQRALAQTADLPCEISWVRAKMQAIPFSCIFDVVLAVDAFGYFETDREDVAVLREVHRVLRKGGCLIMLSPNPLMRPVRNP
jgi:SAM-dependent methyltransferase